MVVLYTNPATAVVVQWIERPTPNGLMQVRFPPMAHERNKCLFRVRESKDFSMFCSKTRKVPATVVELPADGTLCSNA